MPSAAPAWAAAAAPVIGDDTGPTVPTAHTCNGGRGPFFGRKMPGCPRCDELLAGAPARQLPQWRQDLIEAAQSRRDEDARRAQEIKAHFAPGGPHARKECGPVCTFGDW